MKKINYRKEAQGRDCTIRIPDSCNGNPETVVLCHLPGGGMGYKRKDWQGAWGCSGCHDAVDGRVPAKQDMTLLSLWLHEGVMRTQEILESEGKLNV